MSYTYMSPNVSTMKKLEAYYDSLNIEIYNVYKAWLEKASIQNIRNGNNP